MATPTGGNTAVTVALDNGKWRTLLSRRRSRRDAMELDESVVVEEVTPVRTPGSELASGFTLNPKRCACVDDEDDDDGEAGSDGDGEGPLGGVSEIGAPSVTVDDDEESGAVGVVVDVDGSVEVDVTCWGDEVECDDDEEPEERFDREKEPKSLWV